VLVRQCVCAQRAIHAVLVLLSRLELDASPRPHPPPSRWHAGLRAAASAGTPAKLVSFALRRISPPIIWHGSTRVYVLMLRRLVHRQDDAADESLVSPTNMSRSGSFGQDSPLLPVIARQASQVCVIRSLLMPAACLACLALPRATLARRRTFTRTRLSNFKYGNSAGLHRR
jgi:hypothetical protein